MACNRDIFTLFTFTIYLVQKKEYVYITFDCVPDFICTSRHLYLLGLSAFMNQIFCNLFLHTVSQKIFIQRTRIQYFSFSKLDRGIQCGTNKLESNFTCYRYLLYKIFSYHIFLNQRNIFVKHLWVQHIF
jgi:hypothetical protein